MSDEELVRLQLHKNDWWVRQSRRLLQERAYAGKLGKDVRPLPVEDAGRAEGRDAQAARSVGAARHRTAR